MTLNNLYIRILKVIDSIIYPLVRRS